MPSAIQLLSDSLISKIAAGEVVERPSSVVKELVENALDAGATEISVEVEKGGRSLIFVGDNGGGMSAEDLGLAVQRHATSKIHDEKDLFAIRSLGFRGEALAAIAAISFLRIESRKEGEEVGNFIELEGGQTTREGKASLPAGTRIQVRQLFYNTPARLKFLKSPETEALHIKNVLEAYALSYPETAFVFRRDGREELTLKRGESLEERIRSLLGEEIAGSLFPFQGTVSSLEISGYCSSPELNSSTTRSLFFFVNGRYVKDRTLQHAVLSSYENLLMKGRFPWAVLYLQIPPGQVDVNVHPTKAEVRFANGSVVHDGVREVIRKKLSERPWQTSPLTPLLSKERGAEGGERSDPAVTLPLIPSHQGRGTQFHFTQTAYGSLQVIGQVHGTYLVCESADNLVLIDQHAAHERIGFEKLKKQYEGQGGSPKGDSPKGGSPKGIESQRLLIPENIDLAPSETALLKKYSDELHTFGLDVDFFGGNTFVIRAIPALLNGADYPALIQDLVAEIATFEKLTPLQEKFHEVLERIACHRQVRAGDRLSSLEIQALLRDLEGIPFSSNCPHGRPVGIEISWKELEKGFRRRL
ncbi:MAG: DNA mismatch repair endonuclease MutL [Deltaproteobacteria bacterium]|nr:DNA mismatch repair endonuclease MutL [Deltaproteobacteria bacterium]